jgi:hypothetical protein
VGVDVDNLDYGEGGIFFQWEDPVYGHEGLEISFWDLNCSRKMPIRSGDGLPEIVGLTSDTIMLHFSPKLARQLELNEKVEITFDISDEECTKLKRAVDFIKEVSRFPTDLS